MVLFEIGNGSAIHKYDAGDRSSITTKQVNKDFEDVLMVIKGILGGAPPPQDFDYPAYWNATKECLEHDTFRKPPFLPSDDRVTIHKKLKRRKGLIYDYVVQPLDHILIATQWKSEMDSIGALEEKMPLQNAELLPKAVETPKKNHNTAREAEKWLRMIEVLNREIMAIPPSLPIPAKVRIAILDTGYDPQTAFFITHGKRILGWKDWINSEPSAIDTHGHGTHLLGLIMRVAPEAEVFVARIAKTPEDLDNVDNVAQVYYILSDPS